MLRCLLVLLLLLPQVIHAAPTRFLLGWEFPHALPHLTGFQITVADLATGQQDVLQVAPSVPRPVERAQTSRPTRSVPNFRRVHRQASTGWPCRPWRVTR